MFNIKTWAISLPSPFHNVCNENNWKTLLAVLKVFLRDLHWCEKHTPGLLENNRWDYGLGSRKHLYLVRWGSELPWWSPCCLPEADPEASCSGTKYEWSSAAGHRPPVSERRKRCQGMWGANKTLSKVSRFYYTNSDTSDRCHNETLKLINWTTVLKRHIVYCSPGSFGTSDHCTAASPNFYAIPVCEQMDQQGKARATGLFWLWWLECLLMSTWTKWLTQLHLTSAFACANQAPFSHTTQNSDSFVRPRT